MCVLFLKVMALFIHLLLLSFHGGGCVQIHERMINLHFLRMLIIHFHHFLLKNVSW
jgi:hypothetical protein